MARLHGVSFDTLGQRGFTLPTDPRYTLTFFNGASGSYVRHCSFSNSYSTALGVFDTPGVEMFDNVIHGAYMTGTII